MSKAIQPTVEFTISPEAIEQQALRYILDCAKAFYADPDNVKAYQEWKAKRDRITDEEIRVERSIEVEFERVSRKKTSKKPMDDTSDK